MEGQPWDSKLTPTIKDEAIAELARRYGGGASEPITLIGGTSTSRRRRSPGLTVNCAAQGSHLRAQWHLQTMTCVAPPAAQKQPRRSPGARCYQARVARTGRSGMIVALD